jgi:hypothetical protein
MPAPPRKHTRQDAHELLVLARAALRRADRPLSAGQLAAELQAMGTPLAAVTESGRVRALKRLLSTPAARALGICAYTRLGKPEGGRPPALRYYLRGS